LRYSGTKAFIDDPEIEGHGDGRSFIGCCVEKLPIHHDGNGSEAGFALLGNLNESDRARPLVNFALLPVLNDWALSEER
jgi:hypothetical protein